MAVVPAFVTLIGLLVQLNITNGLEEKRRAVDAEQRRLDREATDRERESEREALLDDYWRVERRRMHEAMIGALETTRRMAIVRSYRGRGLLTQPEYEEEMAELCTNSTGRPDLEEVLSRAQLIISDESREAAVRATEAANALSRFVTSRKLRTQEDGTLVHDARNWEEFGELRAIYDYELGQYTLTIRRDLGTSLRP